MTTAEERIEVMKIMTETTGQPKKRDRRLKELASRHGLCPGVVCKCDEPNRFCPRHGRAS